MFLESSDASHNRSILSYGNYLITEPLQNLKVEDMFKFLDDLFGATMGFAYMIFLILFFGAILLIGGFLLYVIFDLSETWWIWLLLILLAIIAGVIDGEYFQPKKTHTEEERKIRKERTQEILKQWREEGKI